MTPSLAQRIERCLCALALCLATGWGMGAWASETAQPLAENPQVEKRLVAIAKTCAAWCVRTSPLRLRALTSPTICAAR